MEELKERYNNLLQAYSRLGHMINKFLEIEDSIELRSCEIEDECIAFRDSVIKRFEFCYDLTWKFFKLYLQNNYGIDVTSPKKVFQECIKQNLVPADKADLLLETIEASNNSSHMYNEEVIHDIALRIPEYYDLFIKMTKKISV